MTLTCRLPDHQYPGQPARPQTVPVAKIREIVESFAPKTHASPLLFVHLSQTVKLVIKRIWLCLSSFLIGVPGETGACPSGPCMGDAAEQVSTLCVFA